MFPKATQIGRKKVTPEANERVQELARAYALTLVTEAKTLAYHRRDDLVLPNHVEEARIHLRAQRDYKPWWKDWLNFIGGGLFGTFLQGFIDQIARGATMNVTLLVVFVIAGFVGVVCFFVGLRQ